MRIVIGMVLMLTGAVAMAYQSPHAHNQDSQPSSGQIVVAESEEVVTAEPEEVVTAEPEEVVTAEPEEVVTVDSEEVVTTDSGGSTYQLQAPESDVRPTDSYYIVQVGAYRKRNVALTEAAGMDDNLLRMVISQDDKGELYILMLGIHPDVASANSLGEAFVKANPDESFWVRNTDGKLGQALQSGVVVVPGPPASAQALRN
jgi:hypothetical protein